MTAITPHRRPATWMLALAGAVLIVALLVSFAVMPVSTDEVPDAPAQPDTVAVVVLPQAQHDRAGLLAAARHELAGLRSAVRDTPSIRDSQHDRLLLLTLVSANDIPVEALTSNQR